MTFAEFLFWAVGLMTCLSAVMVVATQNIVRAAVWLLFTLGGVAGLFFLLGADFLGAAQLIVYVGGILILVIFGVMLTAQGPFVNLKATAGETVFAMVVGLILLGLLGSAIFVTPWRGMTPTDVPTDPAKSPAANDIGLAMLGFEQASAQAKLTIPQPKPKPKVGATTDTKPANEPKNPKDTSDLKDRQQVAYLLPFEIVSVHLVVVLVGAAYLARAKRRKREKA
jgi:NADH:ubiquinone oxidoreductase subunit 6 (subunit J)